MRAWLTPLLGAALLAGLAAAGVHGWTARADACAAEESTEEVAPGVVLTWTSSLHCQDMAESGSYQVTVTVRNEPGSRQSVTLSSLSLSHVTPRPGGRAPQAAASSGGLAVSLAPGESGSFTIDGTYSLAATDEGSKANLHLRAQGTAADGTPFRLGINVLLRGAGASEEAEGEAGQGKGGQPTGPQRGPDGAGGQEHRERSTICHRSEEGRHLTLTLPRPAAVRHLAAHGDSEGACP